MAISVVATEIGLAIDVGVFLSVDGTSEGQVTQWGGYRIETEKTDNLGPIN